MILDYAYDQSKRVFSISYIKENGLKAILNFNVNRFKTYYSTPNGRYLNWDGSKCEVKYTSKPTGFDQRTFLEELDQKHKDLILGKTPPKLYTFDIETEFDPDEFPDPAQAKFPITTISIVNPECQSIVLGTKELLEEDLQKINQNVNAYIRQSHFWGDLGIDEIKLRYIKFNSEHDMLKYFLEQFVAKVPILAGWNSILFDWQYIQNRIIGYFPDLHLSMASMNGQMYPKKFADLRNGDVRLRMPQHTLILDMMDVIGTYDLVVMPIKESLSLDYVSSEMLGIGKIQYDGNLQELYERDYPTYVYYNCVDSILVQMLDKRFKTLANIYVQSLYCRERIGACFSKIAISEAVFFNYFFEEGIKVVPVMREDVERGKLVGAYVKEPIPGIHHYVCCNDFSGLYPSEIQSSNLSFENYMGKDFTEEELDAFRKDPNYYVSVNNVVYKNDRDYAFRIIQRRLKNNRNGAKYLSKKLDAMIVSDATHILHGREFDHREYPEDVITKMAELGYDVKRSEDLTSKSLDELIKTVKKEIEFLSSFEQANKLIMNSLYGGSSHVAFFWFNMDVANDITGGGRNAIHLMEEHIPKFFQENWFKLTDVHKKLGIKLKPESEVNSVTPLVSTVYGDTDSLYISYDGLLSTIKGFEDLSVREKTELIVRFNKEFVNDHNKEFLDNWYAERHGQSVHDFELETVAFSGVWLDVKKRYAQILLWKDGKYYDEDDLPMKIKGLEMVKSSIPGQARKSLKRLVRYLLETSHEPYLVQRINMVMMEEKQKFFDAPIESICGNMKVNNYKKYILDDADPLGLKVAPKCPINVRALGNYNRLRQIHKLSGEPVYGGKVKWYYFYPYGRTSKKTEPQPFAFVSGSYPKWADQYAPISRIDMFQQFVVDPLNRILESNKIQRLTHDGSIQVSLF